MKRTHRLILAIAWLMMTSLAAGQTEDFYEAQLRLGRDAYRGKRGMEAVNQLRIASFGLLDRPVLLAESLARLALAQAAVGRPAEAQATLSRFVELERFFASFPKVQLEPDVEAEFKLLLLQKMPRERLLSVASVASLVKTEEQSKGEQVSRAERQRRGHGNAGSGRSAASESPAGRAARASDMPQISEQVARSGNTHGKKNPGEEASAARSSRGPEALAESRRLVREGRAREAEKILAGAVREAPGSRELRLALLEASCLSRDWEQGAAQLSAVSPFSEGEAKPMFYAAVVLFETGRTEEARRYMEQALPRLSGPFVDEYARKILGRP